MYEVAEIGHTTPVKSRGLRLLSLATLMLAAVCLAPGVASAVIRTVTITDPQDAPAPAAGAAKSPDLQSLQITYDNGAGSIVVVVRFFESIAARQDETDVTFGLGARPGETGYQCEAAPTAPALNTAVFMKQHTGVMILDGLDSVIGQSTASLSADGLTFTMRFASAALVGRDYRCAYVSSVWMSAYTLPVTCNFFGCPTTSSDLDLVDKNAWFDGFAPVPAAPTNVAVTSATANSLAVQWKDADTSVTGYEVLQDGQVVGTTTSTSFTVPGLACGKSYTVAVRADTSYTHSADTTVSAETTVCAPKSPARVKVVGTTATSLTVAWAAPAHATDYVVLVGSHSGRTTSTRLTVAGLHCGTKYAVKVHAVGPGGASASVTVAGRTRHC